MMTEPRPASSGVLAIIATYNERENILLLVEQLLALPPMTGSGLRPSTSSGLRQELSVLVVDDHSPDGTAEALRSRYGNHPRVFVLERERKLGYGTAMVAGFRYALERGFGVVVTLDADFSHDPSAVPALLAALESADVVLGSRYKDGVRVLNWPPRRLMLSLGANWYVRTLLGLPTRDSTSGFRAYRRSVLEAIELQSLHSQGYAFLVEVLYRAYLCRFSIAEVPIIFTERREGQSKMSTRVMLESALAPLRLLLSRNRLHKRLHK